MSQGGLLHLPVAKLNLQRCRRILTDYHHLRIIATTPDDSDVEGFSRAITIYE